MSPDIHDYALMPLKLVEPALAYFDCGRDDIDDFFHNKAQAYEKAMFGKTYAFKAWFSSENNKSGCRFLIVDAYNEPGLIQFYERCGLHLFFTSEEQEKKYRNINDREGEPPVKLETRLMFFDLINYNIEK